MSRNRPETRRRKRSILPGCLGVGLGLPLTTLLILWFVFLLNNRPPNLTVPTQPPLANNGYNDFLRAARINYTIKHKSPISMIRPPTDDAWLLKVSEACAKDTAPALAIIRQSLSKPCQAPPDRSLDSFSDHGKVLRELTRSLYAVALYYHLSGQPEKAMETMLDGEEMAVMLPQGGGTHIDMIAQACESISLVLFEEVLPRLSPTELAQVARRMARIEAKRYSYADALDEEGNVYMAHWIESFQDPKNRSIKARFQMISEQLNWKDNHPLTWQENWQASRSLLANKADMIQEEKAYFKAIAEEARKPFTGSSQVPAPESFIVNFGSLYSVDVRKMHLVGEVLPNLYRTEVALYRYKAASGRFPDKLSQLVPTYLREVPVDPFAGTARLPYRYKTRNGGKGFLLYSLGLDMEDNAGSPPLHSYYTTPGDIVAGHLGEHRKSRP